MSLTINRIDGEEYVKHVYPEKMLCQEIGEPSLKRNRILKISNNKIIKIYGETSRWLREVNSLRFLQYKDMASPCIHATGRYLGFDWVVMSAIPGVILAEHTRFEPSNKHTAFYEVGIYHARYHEICSVKYYGDWDFIEVDQSYASFIKRFHLEFIKSIQNETRHDLTFFEKCFSLIDKFDTDFDYQGGFTLCHNDFDARNILIDASSSKITGIIDFERSFFAEPLFDMTRMLLLDNLENIDSSSYLKGYEDYVGYKINRSRLIYYLLLKGIHICSWSYDIAHDYYIKSKRLLENIVNEYCEE